MKLQIYIYSVTYTTLTALPSTTGQPHIRNCHFTSICQYSTGLRTHWPFSVEL